MNAEISTPLPQAPLGGEGRVRGQRRVLLERRSNARRLPLTPALYPIAFAMEERENSLEAA